MPYRSLDHIGFTVSSLDRSIPFYSQLLGTEPVMRLKWEGEEYVGRIVGYPDVAIEAAFFSLPGGGVLELLQYHRPGPASVDMETFNTGNAHLALASEDIHADVERLRGLVELRNPEPVQIPAGPAKGGWALYVRDPDGITIELIQAPPEQAEA